MRQKIKKNETTLLPFAINGKMYKKNVKYYSKGSWDLRSFAMSECVWFKAKDKKLMRVLFNHWFKFVTDEYGKSKYIECMVFCRREQKNKKIK